MLRSLLRDHRARFATVGLAMTLLHLALFRAVSPFTVPEVANATAFVLATQVNFLASYHWTWASRRASGREPLAVLARRALLFNASVTVAFLVNSAAFWAVHRLFGLPPTASVLAATVVSAGVAYLVSSSLVFARSATTAVAPAAVTAAAPVAVPVSLVPATSSR